LGDGGSRHTECVRALVEAGADRNIPDRQGVIALQHARSRGYGNIVEILTRK
jgi:ankyrin repeat protein